MNDDYQGEFTVIMKASSPIQSGDLVHLDSKTGEVYVKGKIGCDIYKRNFLTPPHHILPLAFYPSLHLNLTNGITLCITHHNEAHGVKYIVNLRCMLKDCHEKHCAKGYCMNHYRLWRKYGTPERRKKKGYSMQSYCTIIGCKNKLHGKNLCAYHYQINWRQAKKMVCVIA